MFESYVILDTTKTKAEAEHYLHQFESYVILDTTKLYNKRIVQP